MPVAGLAGRKKRNSAASVLNLRDLVDEKQQNVDWPQVFRLPDSRSPVPTKNILSRSPAATKPESVLFIHGTMQCSAVCLRNPFDLSTCAVTTSPASGPDGGGHNRPCAKISIADRTVLFERVLAAASTSADTSKQPSSGGGGTGDLTKSYRYDSRAHSSLRELLLSMEGDLARHAVRFQARRAAPQVQDSTVVVAKSPLLARKSPPPGSQSTSLRPRQSTVDEYILFASSCSGTGVSPWQQVASDASCGRVAAWHLKPSSGRVCLEAVSLELDDVSIGHGHLHVCSNVAYQTAHELARMMGTLAHSGLPSKLRVRAIPAQQNVELPTIRDAVTASDGGAGLQVLPLEAFAVSRKPLVLASHAQHCILFGTDIELPLARVAGNDAAAIPTSAALPHCEASRALARLVLGNPDLLAACTDLHVCDLPIQQQLTATAVVSLAPEQKAADTDVLIVAKSPTLAAPTPYLWTAVEMGDRGALGDTELSCSSHSDSLRRSTTERISLGQRSPIRTTSPSSSSGQENSQDAKESLHVPGMSRFLSRSLTDMSPASLPPPLPMKVRSASPMQRKTRQYSLPDGGESSGELAAAKRFSVPAGLAMSPPSVEKRPAGVRQGRDRQRDGGHGDENTDTCVYVHANEAPQYAVIGEQDPPPAESQQPRHQRLPHQPLPAPDLAYLDLIADSPTPQRSAEKRGACRPMLPPKKTGCRPTASPERSRVHAPVSQLADEQSTSGSRGGPTLHWTDSAPPKMAEARKPPVFV